jgi:hypothetical protein
MARRIETVRKRIMSFRYCRSRAQERMVAGHTGRLEAVSWERESRRNSSIAAKIEPGVAGFGGGFKRCVG